MTGEERSHNHLCTSDPSGLTSVIYLCCLFLCHGGLVFSMPTKSEWYEIVEAAYAAISPRDDPKITVHNVDLIDDETCTALVNPPGSAGWVDNRESVEVEGNTVSLREIEGETGAGEQSVRVRLGF